jgi:hypothetical protein
MLRMFCRQWSNDAGCYMNRHGETLRKPRSEMEMELVVVGVRGGICVEEAFEMLLGSERDALFEGFVEGIISAVVKGSRKAAGKYLDRRKGKIKFPTFQKQRSNGLVIGGKRTREPCS